MASFFFTRLIVKGCVNMFLIVILLIIMWSFILGLLLKGVGKLPKLFQGLFGIFGGIAGGFLLIILTILILVSTMLM